MASYGPSLLLLKPCDRTLLNSISQSPRPWVDRILAELRVKVAQASTCRTQESHQRRCISDSERRQSGTSGLMS